MAVIEFTATDVLLVLFVFSQSMYFVVTVVATLMLYVRQSNPVEALDSPPTPRMQVLIPVHRERREMLESTVEHVFEQEYPGDRIFVYVIYEPDDELTESYVHEVVADAREERMTVYPVRVNETTLLRHTSTFESFTTLDTRTRTKAAALTYAFITLSFHPDDVVTVFDSDTRVPTDLFSLATSGLQQYDLVQAKQTVRNVDDGWLPALEAMGIAAWSHIVYGKTAKGPYQLLGKAYFLSARTLNAIGEWEPDAVTEDMALGVEASLRGHSMGVLDRYVQDLCPSSVGAWVRQKRRWVRGPYRYLLDRRLAGWPRVRFTSYTVANQVLSVTNVVGVPSGIAYFVWSLRGTAPEIHPFFALVLAVNLAGWLAYSAWSVAATEAAVNFDSRRQRLRFYLRSNPVTQVLYATLWTVPIVLAVSDVIRRRSPEFEVTPK
jgi:cellulose synthase/poly-beta-1,6-N-acetylglucosamine synthase-like glycosyltransferase